MKTSDKTRRSTPAREGRKNGRPVAEKHRRFVAEYLVSLNATQAAIRAGYSRKTARAQGSRLLTHADIRRLIDEGEQTRAQKLELSSEFVVRRLLEVQRDERDGQTVRALELIGKHIGMWPNVVTLKKDPKDMTLEELVAWEAELRAKYQLAPA